MQEIEVKARIKDPATLITKLETMGCQFSDPIHQIDTIYIPIGATIPVPQGVNVLRIREQDGKYILTLKQPITNQLDCIERETEVINAPQMHDMIRLLGFEKSSRVEKKRKKSKYKNYEICIDEVIDLGIFIEVETFGEDAQTLQKELFTFLETLGVKKQDQEFMGYDILLKNLRERRK
ncbi:MAG TPA: class IV adenylate cyclase [Candidatus Levybacteria bacterium]|nr:class IV adenylate cyclase [Candidatus Levybacteria bacterium]